jgi:hypothetical protein
LAGGLWLYSGTQPSPLAIYPKTPIDKDAEIAQLRQQLIDGAKSGSQNRSAARLNPVVSQPTPPLQQPNLQQSPIDSLIETNKRLPNADREQLAQALIDFSKVLDQANFVWGKANNIDSDLSPKDFESRKTKLRNLLPLAKDYERQFYQVRQKWHYYDHQISYIFGDDPDNDAAIIENAATEYLNYLNSLGKIQSTEDGPVLNILSVEQGQYGLSTNRFAHWRQGCGLRLDQMKSSIQ